MAIEKHAITAGSALGKQLGLKAGEVAFGASGPGPVVNKQGSTITISQVAPARTISRTVTQLVGRAATEHKYEEKYAVFNSVDAALANTRQAKVKTGLGNLTGLAAVLGAATFGVGTIVAAGAAGAAAGASAAGAAAGASSSGAGLLSGSIPAFTAGQTAAFNASLAAGTVGSTAAVGSIAGTTASLSEAAAGIKASEIIAGIKANVKAAADVASSATSLRSAFTSSKGAGSVEHARAGAGIDLLGGDYPFASSTDAGGADVVTADDATPGRGPDQLNFGLVLAALAALVVMRIAA